MPIIAIADPADPRLADYGNIPDPELLERKGIFMAEGRLVVRRLLAGGRFPTRSVMATSAALGSLAGALDSKTDVPIYVVPQALMNGVTGFNMHRGCLAIGERGTPDDWRALTARAARIVALEQVANADNVGAIFRSAAAFAADAILLDAVTTDPLYRKAIRTSMGAALSVPFARAEPWLDALHEMGRQGIMRIGLTPAGHATPLRDVAATVGDARMALVLGHEGDGLSTGALDACDVLARIPMAPGVDSLNVATAAAIVLYAIAAA